MRGERERGRRGEREREMVMDLEEFEEDIEELGEETKIPLRE
jgi:hypothetical protein